MNDRFPTPRSGLSSSTTWDHLYNFVKKLKVVKKIKASILYYDYQKRGWKGLKGILGHILKPLSYEISLKFTLLLKERIPLGDFFSTKENKSKMNIKRKTSKRILLKVGK